MNEALESFFSLEGLWFTAPLNHTHAFFFGLVVSFAKAQLVFYKSWCLQTRFPGKKSRRHIFSYHLFEFRIEIGPLEGLKE
jgi:hypothetical protein